MVRLDAEGKAFLAQAAELRRISVSDYVRTVTVPQARAEVFAAREQTSRRVQPQLAVLLLLAVAAVAIFDQNRPDFQFEELSLIRRRLRSAPSICRGGKEQEGQRAPSN